MTTSIDNLEKSVRRWVARKYPERACGGSDGLDVDVEVFRGHGRPPCSSVKVTVAKYRGEDQVGIAQVRFWPLYGGGVTDPRCLGGPGVRWSEMARAAEAHIDKELVTGA